MIRAITPEDSATVSTLAVASGLFPIEAIAFVDKMMANYFGGNADESHVCVIAVEGEPLGVAYYQPALATDRTWYLTMIGVRRDKQGQGHGATLMEYVEKTLQESGQRVLLVETSGSEDFALTRKFYTKCGYEQEARVRDYYAAGEDMVLFRKVLNVE
ncbi:MAG: GNAT family N-acetyltransferase [Chloroflexaceae bacterium]|nr:GNAT family N-acetyltransferase [Chloroflexaceae bacterium]